MDMTSIQDRSSVLAAEAVSELKRMAFYREAPQEDIANTLGVSRQTLNRKLNDSSTMSLNDFVEISATLDIKPSEVFRRAEKQKEKAGARTPAE